MNSVRPIYCKEICDAIATPERTLRTCCEEHLGMGPMRYLWPRRMHLARNALARANPATSTVTEITTEFGFWSLDAFRRSIFSCSTNCLQQHCGARQVISGRQTGWLLDSVFRRFTRPERSARCQICIRQSICGVSFEPYGWANSGRKRLILAKRFD